MRARRRWVAALVISASLLVPLVVFGGTALATGFAALAQYGHGPGSAQYQYNGKVTICHATHSAKNPFVTIVVSPQGAANHLKHHDGDKAGACATTHSSAARDNQHGKGKDQGQAKKQDHGQANSQSANESKDDHGKGRDDDEDDDKGGGQGNGNNGNNGSNGKGHNK